MDLSRRSFVGGLAMLGAGAALPRFAFGKPSGFRIAFVSDVHAPESRSYRPILKSSAEAINLSKPALIVFLGDNFYSCSGPMEIESFAGQAEQFAYLRDNVDAPSVVTLSDGDIADEIIRLDIHGMLEAVQGELEIPAGNWKLRFTESVGPMTAGENEILIRSGPARHRAENKRVLPYETDLIHEFKSNGPLTVSSGTHRHQFDGKQLQVGSLSGDWWFGNAQRSFAVVELLDSGAFRTSEIAVV